MLPPTENDKLKTLSRGRFAVIRATDWARFDDTLLSLRTQGQNLNFFESPDGECWHFYTAENRTDGLLRFISGHTVSCAGRLWRLSIMSCTVGSWVYGRGGGQKIEKDTRTFLPGYAHR